ncbi:MAG: IS5 family transposase [Bacteroidales bacterium]
MIKENVAGFADMIVEKRKVKEAFFKQIDTIINWKQIDKEIKKYYRKGQSVDGRPSYSGLVLFKICLLQTWYCLSDYEVEEQVNDRISFSRFVGISMDDKSPDHSVMSRFRTSMTNKKAYNKLLKMINKQLEEKQIIVKTGLLVDASVTDTPRKPKGKKEYEIVEDRKEEEGVEVSSISLQELPKRGVDGDAKWLKKGGKLHYGYKQHVGTDENGMIRVVITTAANESDIKHLEDVIEAVDDFDHRAWIKADKGYQCATNDQVIKTKKMRNHIMHKALKKKPLTKYEKLFNRLVSKIRYRVERSFGSMRRWFGGGRARYVGIEKMHTQHLMEAIAHNLYRAPAIAVSIRVK